MPIRFTRRILDHLAHPGYRPSGVNDTARELRVEADDRAVFDEAIERLEREHRVEIDHAGTVRLPSLGDEVVGGFRLNARGFGFVIPDHPVREGDLFIPRGRTRDALSGDRVRARVIFQKGRAKAKSGRSPYTGQVEEVLERGRDHFVGVLFERGGSWFVEPGGRTFYEPVLIRDPHARNAAAGDQVVIEMLHYPDDRHVPNTVGTEDAADRFDQLAATVANTGIAKVAEVREIFSHLGVGETEPLSQLAGADRLVPAAVQVLQLSQVETQPADHCLGNGGVCRGVRASSLRIAHAVVSRVDCRTARHPARAVTP